MDDYIKRVEFTEMKCAYFIGTCAQTPWRTAEYVEKLCEKKSFSLFGFHSIIMPQGMYSLIISDRSFITTAQCTGCGQCRDRCPLNNIKLVNSRPIWGKNCTHCMACIAGCPSEAIEYGKKTQGKPRYYLGDDE